MVMTPFLYKIYYNTVRPIRSNRMIHRCLFGYFPYRGSEVHGGYWDWTTLVLKKALRLHLGANSSFLDMGTGSVGCLPIFASLRLGCTKNHAVDYITEIVSSAKRCAEPLHLPVEFYCSDLFSNVQGRFDIIAFNAPYLDFEKGKDLGILKDRVSEMRFSGGKGGGETIIKFLRDAQEHMSESGSLLLGVCHYHISESSVREMIFSSGLEVRECVTCSHIPSAVYVLYKR